MNVLIDLQERRRAVVTGRALARVGDEAQVFEHYKRTNANILSTENEISKWVLATEKKIHDRVVKGGFNDGACEKDVAVSLCMTDKENEINDWIKNSWVPFVKRWNDHIRNARVGWFDNDVEVSKYDKELDLLRGQYVKLTSASLPPLTPTMTDMDKSWDPLGGIKTGSQIGGPSITETVSRLIWIAGIGVLIFLGAVYILPAFLGAGATARAAKRRYEEA